MGNQQDPTFTLDNICYIKRLAKLLIASIIFSSVSGFIIQIIMRAELSIEIETFQLDSKGIMYDKKVK